MSTERADSLQPLALQQINHFARPTSRLEESRRFYRDVLGFVEITRPNFPFRGAWLYGPGIQVHLIEQEQAIEVPTEVNTRARHLAFAVHDLDEAERLLQRHGVAYKRNLIPDRQIRQLFFHDPDGHVIELGVYGRIDV